MKVKELIAELQKLDPEKEVWIPAVKSGGKCCRAIEGKHSSTKDMIVLKQRY